MFGKFPFQDKKNTATITCCHIMREGQPILYACHDADDGMWQFLCGKTHATDEAMVVALDEVYQIDKSIAAIARLPLGYEAWRESVDAEWSVGPK